MTKFAREEEAIPVVVSTAARALRFPNPTANQRVQNLETAQFERYDASNGWTGEGPAGTPATILGVLSRAAKVYIAGDPRWGLSTSTSDNSAAASALHLQAAADGAAVFYDAVYPCSNTVTIPSSSHLFSYACYGGLSFDWTLASTHPNYITNLDTTNGNSNITLSQLYIKGAGNGTPFGSSPVPVSGVMFRRGTGIRVLGCEFYRIPGISLSPQGIRNFHAVANYIHEGGRDGITGYWFTDNLEGVVIADNIIDLVGDDGIAVHASASGVPNTSARPRRIRIANNVIVNRLTSPGTQPSRGICITGCEKFSISGNEIYSTFCDGVLIKDDTEASSSLFTSRHGRIVDNTIWRAGQVGDGSQPQNGVRIRGSSNIRVAKNTIVEAYAHGVLLEDVADDVTVEANDIIDCGTTLRAHFGVACDGTNGVVDVKRPVIRNNRISGSAGAGVWIWYCERAKVENNECINNGRVDSVSNTQALNAGIYAEVGSTQTLVIRDNWCTDTNAGGSKKQSYGFFLNGNATVRIYRNDCAGSVQTDGISYTTTTVRRLGNTSGGTDFDQESGMRRYIGTGTPESVVSAPVGSTFNRTDGGAATCLYIKETGTGTTGWVAK